jgi:hypothetical protein
LTKPGACGQRHGISTTSPISPSAGRRRPTRSTPTSWRMAWTSAACSCSTTTPPRWSLGAADAAGPVPAANDERLRRTVLAVADELTVDRLVLRHRTDQTDDGLAGEEVTFTICSFGWCCPGGDRRGSQGAAAVPEAAVLRQPAGAVRRGTGPAHWGWHLSNFPQVFTHLALSTRSCTWSAPRTVPSGSSSSRPGRTALTRRTIGSLRRGPSRDDSLVTASG